MKKYLLAVFFRNLSHHGANEGSQVPDRRAVAQEPRHRQPRRPGQPRQTCLRLYWAGSEVRVLPGAVTGGYQGHPGVLHATAQVGRALTQPGMLQNNSMELLV